MIMKRIVFIFMYTISHHVNDVIYISCDTEMSWFYKHKAWG